MKRSASVLTLLCLVLTAGILTGCRTRDMSKLRLGIEPKDVIDRIGKPSVIRAAKVYASSEYTEVWEYLPPWLTLYPRTFWVFFESGKVVQWGEPGDFPGGSRLSVGDYTSQKKSN